MSDSTPDELAGQVADAIEAMLQLEWMARVEVLKRFCLKCGSLRKEEGTCC